jgi:deazaflavin-dependent oxidoreductase (nitroreductase family)
MDMRAFNEDVIRRFRAGEQIDGLHRERLVLLTTVGRRSGDEHTAPMMFVDHDGDPLVIASADGAAEHPWWFRNLQADPHVTVETPDGVARQAIAEELAGDERATAWAELMTDFPFLVEHQERAGTRTIPLVRLRSTG